MLCGLAAFTLVALFAYQHQRSETDARPHLAFGLALANADPNVAAKVGTQLEIDQGMGCGGGNISAKKGDAFSCGALLSSSEGAVTMVVSLSRKPGQGWLYEEVSVSKTLGEKSKVTIEVNAEATAPVRHPFRPLVSFD